jgi:peptide/nickel transport system permease protein
MRLLRFTLRRLLLLIPVLIGVTAVTFVLVRVLPGDPVRTILGPTATHADLVRERERLGLNKPLIVQYWDYLRGLLTGDFGTSIQSGQSVGHEMSVRIGATLELVVAALVIALAAAVVFGLISAAREGRPSDHAIRLSSLIGNALPDFWLGLVLILVFYNYWHVLPVPSGQIDANIGARTVTGASLFDGIVTNNGPAVRSALQHLVLPTLTLALVVCASLLRTVRASALEVRASMPYTAAVAHGIGGRRLRNAYLVRATMVRLPTLVALVFGGLLGSTVLVEYVFGWQGLGEWALRGLQYRDYPVVQAAVFVYAFAYVVVFLIADIVHTALDPRIRL